MYFKKLIIICITIWITNQTSNGSVIPAAIIRRHTVHYKDVPTSAAQAIKPQTIFVPASMVNLVVRFLTHSSKVHVNQVHQGSKGQTQSTKSTDEPHILRHLVSKPVIQEIREVIVPYRQVVQEIKPVVEEVKTVVATGQPKSSVYMSFGDNKNNNNNNYKNSVDSVVKDQETYGYVVKTNDDSITTDNSGYKQNSGYNSDTNFDYNRNNNKISLYDLSAIYGINPTNDEINKNYELSAKPINDYNIESIRPVVYAMAHDVDQHNTGYTLENPKNSGYSANSGNSVNTEYSDDNSRVKNPVMYTNIVNNNYESTGPVYDNNHVYDYTTTTTTTDNQKPIYDTNYYGMNDNYEYIAEPQYYVSNDGYYSNSGYTTTNSGNYNTGAYVQDINSSGGYTYGYSHDLATSDGQALAPMHSTSPVLPIFGRYTTQPLAKSATLAQLVQAIPYQYAVQQSSAPVQTYKDA